MTSFGHYKLAKIEYLALIDSKNHHEQKFEKFIPHLLFGPKMYEEDKYV